MLGMLLEAFLRVRYFYRCLCSGFAVILQEKPFSLKDKENIMSDDFVSYELTPPAGMTQEDFVRFVQDKVFPAVEMGEWRSGWITELHLFTFGAAEKYLWVINSGWVSDDSFVLSRTETARQKLEASGTRISALSPYYEVATRVWSPESGSQETGP
jgi:hypothetical protein